MTTFKNACEMYEQTKGNVRAKTWMETKNMKQNLYQRPGITLLTL